MEWWGWSDATSTWRRGRRLGRRALRQGRGGSSTDKGVNAVDAAAGRHTSDEAGENKGGPVSWAGTVRLLWAGPT
jgi:hypothetical protein